MEALYDGKTHGQMEPPSDSGHGAFEGIGGAQSKKIVMKTDFGDLVIRKRQNSWSHIWIAVVVMFNLKDYLTKLDCQGSGNTEALFGNKTPGRLETPSDSGRGSFEGTAQTVRHKEF